VDHFGNIVTSIGPMRWSNDNRLALRHHSGIVRLDASKAVVKIQSETLQSISRAYHEVPRGHLLAQIDSNGYLEVAVNQDDAAQRLDVLIGDVVELLLNQE
jgi:S-adenosylmethionine hydrolase